MREHIGPGGGGGGGGLICLVSISYLMYLHTFSHSGDAIATHQEYGPGNKTSTCFVSPLYASMGSVTSGIFWGAASPPPSPRFSASVCDWPE